MKMIAIFWRRFAPVIMAAPLAFCALQDSAIGQGPLVAEPDPNLYTDVTTSLRFQGNIHARVYANTGGKLVSVAWRYFGDEQAQGSGNVLSVHQSDYAVDFWPTHVRVVTPFTWLVGGIDDGGVTVIERWTFRKKRNQQVLPNIVQSIDPSGSGGGIVYGWHVPPRLTVRRLLSQPSNKPSVVKFIMVNCDQTAALVCFGSDSSLWRMDLVVPTNPLVQVGSPAPSAGLLEVAELSRDFDTMYAMNHVSYGDVYVLIQEDFKGAAQLGPIVLALIDADSDGLPESFVALDGAQWAVSDLGDRDKVTKRW